MTVRKPLHDIKCKYCAMPLVIETSDGQLKRGKHTNDCIVKIPPVQSPARQVAKKRLVCGANCKFPEGEISEINGLAFCDQCPSANLVRSAADAYVKNNGGKKPVEYIFPTERKAINPIWDLYCDLLVRYNELENQLKRYKNS